MRSNIELNYRIKNTESEYEKIIVEIRTQYNSECSTLLDEYQNKVKKVRDEFEICKVNKENEMNEKILIYESRLNKQRDNLLKELTDSKTLIGTLKVQIEEMEEKNKLQLEEHEIELKKERQTHSEEIEALQNELKETELQHRAMIEQLEHENKLLRQKLETQEINIKGIKDQSTKFQSMTSAALEQQLESFTKERRSLLDEIDRMSKIVMDKGEQVNKLKSKTQELMLELQEKEKSVEELKRNKIEERNVLIERLESLKLKNQKISNEYTQKKLEFNKELTLASQHVLLY